LVLTCLKRWFQLKIRCLLWKNGIYSAMAAVMSSNVRATTCVCVDFVGVGAIPDLVTLASTILNAVLMAGEVSVISKHQFDVDAVRLSYQLCTFINGYIF